MWQRSPPAPLLATGELTQDILYLAGRWCDWLRLKKNSGASPLLAATAELYPRGDSQEEDNR